jgi:hypothetical protein
METKNNTNYKFSIEDKDNVLFILYNEIIFMFNGQKWGQIYISDVNMPDTEFKYLKKPGLVEISSGLGEESAKIFLVTGGFIPESKSCVKTVYLLNFKESTVQDELSKKESTSIDCHLDFKFADMKTSRFLHGSVNIEDKFVLVLGGKNEKEWLSSCEYLDLNSGKWHEFSSLNYPRANFDFLNYFDLKKNTSRIYVYGGYSKINTFAENLIEYIDIENVSGELKKTEWKILSLSYDKTLNLPKISTRLVRYDENILIVGGSDGKHMLKDIFEMDDSFEINKVGELNTPRNNFHYLLKEGDVYAVGGSCNKFSYQDDLIDNYVEKFTFNLSNKIESTNIPAIRDLFLLAIQNLSISEFEFTNEPGFPYSSSIMTKQFKNMK